MPQSFIKRFAGRNDEVLEYALNYGIQELMLEYGMADYLSTLKYLQEISGDKDIIYKCCSQTIGNKPVISQIVDEIILRASNLQSSLEQAQRKNRVLEQQIKIYQREDKRFALKLLKELKAVPEINIRGDPVRI